MVDSVIGAGSTVNRSILDKHVIVGSSCVLGDAEDGEAPPYRTEPKNLISGITVVGKRAHIPSGVRIGRNVLIGSEVTERDYGEALRNGRVVPSGATVEVKG